MHKIFYICDRKKCERCNVECKYTSDVTHAAHFESIDRVADGQNIGATNDYFEKDLTSISLPPLLYQPGIGQKDIIKPTWIGDDPFSIPVTTANDTI